MAPKEKRLIVAGILLLLTAIFTYKLRYTRAEVQVLPRLDSVPLSLEDWQGRDFPLDKRTSQILGADLTLNRRYTNAKGETVWLFISYFRDQRYGSQVHSPQNCLPGSGWAILTKDTVILKTGKDNLYSRFLQANKGHKRVEVYYWFVTRSAILADEYALKFDLVANALRGRPTDALFVRLTTAADPSTVEAFLQTIWPQLSNLIPSQDR